MDRRLQEVVRKKLSIPEYYRLYIDSNVNLRDEPKQCCPFHQEDTPSFSYSPERGVWRCFGACKTGGDVIEMHRKWKNLETKEEALDSLCSLIGIDPKDYVSFEAMREDEADPTVLAVATLLRKLELKAKGPERWVQLDQAMSYYEPAADRLERLQGVEESWK